MSEYTFILNPSAGRGSAGKIADPLQKLLREHDVSYDFVSTQGPGEASAIAKTATGQYVVAVGGDGTVNEVANGLVGTEKIMGVIPSGSGNDFVKMISVGPRLDDAFAKLMARKIRKIDVGTVECSGGKSPDSSSPSVRYFVNGVGLGFDAAVAARTREIRYLRGTVLYIAAVLQMLGRYKAPTFRVSANGHVTTSTNLLIAVGNGTCAGGGFYLTPAAKIDDGLLDVCLIEDVSVGTILKLMPRVMRGKHTHAKQVKFLKTKEISFNGDRDFYVHADGEIVGRNVDSVKIQLMSHGLSVISG